MKTRPKRKAFLITVCRISGRDWRNRDTRWKRSAGHDTIPAYDGAEAIRRFQEEKPDLVVLDIMLPKMTGLAVLHEIRRTNSVPVLMLTAIEDEYTQVQSFDEQADDYITKPFSMVLLGKRITALRTKRDAGNHDVW
ncbi:response regulator [Hungatella effluvii]